MLTKDDYRRDSLIIIPVRDLEIRNLELITTLNNCSIKERLKIED